MKNVESFFSNGLTKEYQTGQILLYQGEQAQDVIYITSGFIKIYDISIKGDEKILLIAGKGDIIPLIWKFGKKISLHFFYEVLEDATINVVDREKFINETNVNHAFARELLQYFLDHNTDLMSRIESIEGTSALHKVGQVLSYLCSSHGTETGKKNTSKIKLAVTHQLIANMSGLTRETVSVQMKELRSNKIITTDNSQLFINSTKLEAFLSKDE